MTLQDGTNRQRKAFRALQSLDLFSTLEEYSPVLAGTIPLGIDIADSDLDIICQFYQWQHFERKVIVSFEQMRGFRIRRTSIQGVLSVVANFSFGGFPIEIFGQARPVEEQNAYRHMQVEARLLAIGGEKARRTIRRLKQLGLKTEPAFARYFHLEGDPYQRLLDMFPLSDRELRQIVSQAMDDRG